LIRDIGASGELNAEMEAYLLQMGIDSSPFPERVQKDLATIPEEGWTIPPEVWHQNGLFNKLLFLNLMILF